MTWTSAGKFVFLAGLSLSCLLANAPTVGVASALGTFRVDDIKVEGNANLFAGSRLETDRASSRVFLKNGSILTLGITSAATLYRDHVSLEKGAAKIEGINGYAAQVGALRLKGTEALSQAVVRLDGPTVQIAALSGSVDVFNSHGLVIRRVVAGTAAEFDEASGAYPPQSGSTAGESGATANQAGVTPAQSGATAGQSGASSTGAESEAERRRRRRREAALYLTLGVALGGLGLAVDAILQPGTPSTSP